MRRLTIGICAFSLIVSACRDTGSTRTLSEADNQDEVLLDCGDELEIRLESNATTGFQWIISDAAMPDSVALIEDRYEPPESELVGAPGTQVFTLEATEEGVGILRLEYVRPFDEPMVPERVIEYIIRVDSAPWPPGEPATPPSISQANAP